MLGQVAAVAGSLVLVRVLTEYLSPADYGRLALELTVAALVNQLVFGGLAAGIGRYYIVASGEGAMPGYLRGLLLLLFAATVIIAVLGAAAWTALAPLGLSHWTAPVAAALVLSVINGFNGSLNALQNAARQRPVVALHAGLDSWLRILLVVAVIHWLGAGSAPVILGYAGSALLVTVSQAFFLRRTVRRAMGPQETAAPLAADWSRRIWHYASPFSAWGGFIWIQQVSDRWSLEAFAGTADVGLYAVLFQLGYMPISMVLGMSIAFLSPILYEKSGDATDRSRNRQVRELIMRFAATTLALTALGFLAAFVLHEPLFALLVAVEYRAVSYLLPWIVLAGGLFATAQMLSLNFMSEMKTGALLAPKVLTALVGVGLNIAGAAYAGLNGVILALVAFSAIYLVWMAALAWDRTSDAVQLRA